jgi:Cdc6-like AAA superfamily ATPase
MNAQEILFLKAKIAQTFTPSAPIDRQALFAGRSAQVEKLMNAVFQKGQHAVLFGERGVGKTSLSNVLRDLLRSISGDHFMIGSTNCEASSTFSSIWRAALKDIPVAFRELGMGFTPPVHQDNGTLLDLCRTPDSSENIRHLFQTLQGRNPIIIIDEIDQIRTTGTAKQLADTIKTLSDHATNATLVLVGVADSVDQLISEHISIERALVQIPMPRMSREELHEIIEKGMAEIGMEIEDPAKDRISRLSQGLPHYTHLLGLHAAQCAASRGERAISSADVEYAIIKAVDQAQQSIVSGFLKATTSRRGNLYAQVLTACALAEKDDFSYFSSSDVRDPMSEIMHKLYEIPAFSQHLNDFCEVERGPVLEKSGSPRRYRFRFCNPLMEPYVVMRGIAKGFIPKGALA